MSTPYGIDKKIIDYYVPQFNPTFLTILKFKLFGKKFVEPCGLGRKAVFYLYKDVLYLTKYGNY